MEFQFTRDEMRDALRAARIYCPGFTEEQFGSLIGLQERIAESGYLEVVQELMYLETKKGISYRDAISGYDRLLKEKEVLEKLIPDLQKRSDALTGEIKQAVAKVEQTRQAVAEASQELARVRNEQAVASRQLSQTRNEQAEAQKELETFKENSKKTKQRIDREVKEYREKAKITQEEIASAAQLKAEIADHGFTLEEILELSSEFAGHKNAREELAGVLKERGSIKKEIAYLVDRRDAEKKALGSEVAGLQSQKQALAGDAGNLRNVISQLQMDVAYENEMRQFHGRYWALSPLMDYLASWEQVFFMRCNNPIYAFNGAFDPRLGNTRLWTDKPPSRCPQCGQANLVFDDRIYQALNLPSQGRVTITLGAQRG